MFGPILGESVYCWKTRPLGRPPPSPNRGIYPEFSILEISLLEKHIFKKNIHKKTTEPTCIKKMWVQKYGSLIII